MENEPSLSDLLRQVLKRLDDIEMQIRAVPPVYPINPYPQTTTKCGKCGMEWKGSMAYYCSDGHCPIQPKVTSSIVGVSGNEQ